MEHELGFVDDGIGIALASVRHDRGAAAWLDSDAEIGAAALAFAAESVIGAELMAEFVAGDHGGVGVIDCEAGIGDAGGRSTNGAQAGNAATERADDLAHVCLQVGYKALEVAALTEERFGAGVGELIGRGVELDELVLLGREDEADAEIALEDRADAADVLDERGERQFDRSAVENRPLGGGKKTQDKRVEGRAAGDGGLREDRRSFTRVVLVDDAAIERGALIGRVFLEERNVILGAIGWHFGGRVDEHIALRRKNHRVKAARGEAEADGRAGCFERLARERFEVWVLCRELGLHARDFEDSEALHRAVGHGDFEGRDGRGSIHTGFRSGIDLCAKSLEIGADYAGAKRLLCGDRTGFCRERGLELPRPCESGAAESGTNYEREESSHGNPPTRHGPQSTLIRGSGKCSCPRSPRHRSRAAARYEAALVRAYPAGRPRAEPSRISRPRLRG